MRLTATHFRGPWHAIAALSLLISGPALSAGSTCAASADPDGQGRLQAPKDNPAGVEGTTYKLKDMQAWLALLVGQYTYDGYVAVCRDDDAEDLRPVTGKADCIAAVPSPGVHCTVNVGWPTATRDDGAPVRGGASTLSPAQLLFGIERRIPGHGVMHRDKSEHMGLLIMQMDSNGVAEWASGELAGDTFLSREPCTDGACHKITRITATPGSSQISMTVDFEINNRRVLRQAFVLHREPGSRNAERFPGPTP